MKLNDNIICATTFRQGNQFNCIERVRAEVFLDTVRELSNLDLLLHVDTDDLYLKNLQKYGVITVKQKSIGMGNIRREAIREASLHFPNSNYLCWLEPEKPNIAKFILPMVHKMKMDKTSLGIFNRNNMSSYPPEQSHNYQFCRAVATQFIGFDIDYAFGPMVVPRSSSSYFLEYQGEYGDKWDSILVPRLRIIKNGLCISTLPINFQNDNRMTCVESGNPTIILKRLEQFNNVIPSLVKEWFL